MLSHCPHPDSFAPDLVQQLRAAVEAFKEDNGGSKSLTVLAKAFKNAGCALDRAAPAPGQHTFVAGERAMLHDLKQRADLNGCVAVVKCEANDVEGDGRVEVCVGPGSKKETLRVRPANMRLDWHVAADAHVTSVGSGVMVRRLDSEARGKVCRVEAYDAETRMVSVLVEGEGPSATGGGSARVAIFDVVPAAYGDIAKEVLSCSMKVIMKAVAERHTPGVTAALNALESCATFHIRCARDDEAARVCVTVLKLLHTGGRSGMSARDVEVRRSWTGDFLMNCINVIDPRFRLHGYFKSSCCVLVLCKQILEDFQGGNSLQVAGLLHNIGVLHQEQDHFDEAAAAFQESVRISGGQLGQDSLQVADSLVCLAALFEKQSRLADAENTYTHVLRVREAKLGHDSVPVAAVLNSLGSLMWTLARFSEADSMFKEALRINALLLGHDSSEVAHTLNNIACMYQKQDRHQEAVAILNEALRIKELRFGRDSIHYADALNNLAGLHMKQGQLEDSERMYRHALRIKELAYGHDSLKVSFTISSLAVVLRMQGRLQEAAASYKEALRIQVMIAGPSSLDVARTLNNLAVLHERLLNLEQAEAAFKAALDIMDEKVGRESTEVAGLLGNLGTFYERHDRLAEAEIMYKEALRINELHGSSCAAGSRSNLDDLHPPPLSDIGSL
jgi:tetratricopeptide (TPR) repeat protein